MSLSCQATSSRPTSSSRRIASSQGTAGSSHTDMPPGRPHKDTGKACRHPPFSYACDLRPPSRGCRSHRRFHRLTIRGAAEVRVLKTLCHGWGRYQRASLSRPVGRSLRRVERVEHVYDILRNPGGLRVTVSFGSFPGRPPEVVAEIDLWIDVLDEEAWVNAVLALAREVNPRNPDVRHHRHEELRQLGSGRWWSCNPSVSRRPSARPRGRQGRW